MDFTKLSHSKHLFFIKVEVSLKLAVVPRLAESQMTEAFLAEKYMAEKQGFPYMTEYLNWPNLYWLNRNWPKLN